MHLHAVSCSWCTEERWVTQKMYQVLLVCHIQLLEFWKSHLGMTLLLTAVAGSHSRRGRFHSVGYSGSRLLLRLSYARTAAVLLREGLLSAAITAVSIPVWLFTVVVLKLSAGLQTYHEPKRHYAFLAEHCVTRQPTSPPSRTATQWHCSPGTSLTKMNVFLWQTCLESLKYCSTVVKLWAQEHSATGCLPETDVDYLTMQHRSQKLNQAGSLLALKNQLLGKRNDPKHPSAKIVIQKVWTIVLMHCFEYN